MQQINVLQGFLSRPDTWAWNNVTSNFTTVVSPLFVDFDVHLSGPCSAYYSQSGSLLYCIVRGNNGSANADHGGLLVVDFSITASGKLVVQPGSLKQLQRALMVGSDILQVRYTSKSKARASATNPT